MPNKEIKTKFYHQYVIIEQIRANLTPDLLKPKYRGRPWPTGYCYVASEAFYALYGKENGYKPRCYKKDTFSHWWLEHPENGILDITADQFPDGFKHYEEGRHQNFMMMHFPSKGAKKLIRRIDDGKKPLRVKFPNIWV
jgi:hypothetical protein